ELSLPGPVRASSAEETEPALRSSPPSDVSAVSPALLDGLRAQANAASLLLVTAARVGEALEVRLALHPTDGSRTASIRIQGEAGRFVDLARAMGDAARHLLGMAPLAGPERTVLATVHPSSLDQAGTLIRARKGRGDLALLERLVAEAP